MGHHGGDPGRPAARTFWWAYFSGLQPRRPKCRHSWIGQHRTVVGRRHVEREVLLRGHDGQIALSPDGRTVVTGSSDKTARLWDAETGQQLEVLSGHEDMVLSVRFSPDGRNVVTASSDRTVRIWPVLPRGQALIDLACARVPWPLTESQQQRFGISEEWCTPEASATLRAKLDMDAPASTH